MAPLSAHVLERLCERTLLRAVEFHPTLGSTNDRALECLAAGHSTLPLLVLTESQTAGRGRRSNRWWSRPGGLTLTVVIDGDAHAIPPHRRSLLSLATGLAVRETLADQLPAADLALKWPNDVYLQSRKVCGILVETSPVRPTALVVGIGLNVNNSFAEAPEELQQSAISLIDVAGRNHDLAELLHEFLLHFERRLNQLADPDWRLLDAWEPHCLLRGRTVELDLGPRRVLGVCRGIDDDGALLLATESGLERLLGGVVSRWD